MTPTLSRNFGKIIEKAITAFDQPSARQKALLDRLRRYGERLAAGSFQLAVLGQFKRGKSTLLNAMIGHSLLATGVLPLTAIPTFLSGGRPLGLTLTYLDGTVEHKETPDFATLAEEIASATTEERNPRNRRRLERVEVTVPSDRWLDAVTLVDTPGVGSTHAHNTEAAETVLPECDAALFVLSVDPPITDVEVGYLKAVCKTVSHVVLVMNKMDLLGPEEREQPIAFLRSVLGEHALTRVDPMIFAVSARAALDARLQGDTEGFGKSGLERLEDHVRSKLVLNKRLYLEESSARNVSAVLADLANDVSMTLSALMLPLSELDEKISVFNEATEGFGREQQALNDLLSGEWRRTLSLLDERAAATEKQVRAEVSERLDIILDPAASEESLQALIGASMTEIFERELGTWKVWIHDRLEGAVATHRERYLALVQRVRDTAATLLQVPPAPLFTDEEFRPKREPYWTSRELSESLGAVTGDWLALLLPHEIRRRRMLRKLRDSALAAVGRNVVGLHWAMRQDIDDAFRRLLAASEEAVRKSLEDTRGLLTIARSSRQSEVAALGEDVHRATQTLETLRKLQREVQQVIDGTL